MIMFAIRWLISPTVRRATAMERHVRKLVAAQRDLLTAQALAAMDEATSKMRLVLKESTDTATLTSQMEKLEAEVGKWLKPYPNAAFRENVEVFLVALAVAMAIRTFFLQPFKIPTGSMQPTLYGITHQNLRGKGDFVMPDRITRVWEYWVHGNSYFHEVAPDDGSVRAVKPPVKMLLFNLKQEYLFNDEWRTVWFPAEDLFLRAGILIPTGRSTSVLAENHFHKGDDIIRLKVTAGDHLFVNRLAYNFVHPARGDIVVFQTKGIIRLGDQNTYYIKRLVGLGGEKLQLKQDWQIQLKNRFGEDVLLPAGHLTIDGRELSAATPKFESLYSTPPNIDTNHVVQYVENTYVGHAMLEGLAADRALTVSPDSYFVMGDNTLNSSDSRYWGDFSRNNVIGKSSFVYWPISSRFGLGYR